MLIIIANSDEFVSTWVTSSVSKETVMSQEYTEDKHIRFKKLSSGRRLLEVILLAICLSAIFLMVALLSFNPSDPSWSQTTWNAPVKNLGEVLAHGVRIFSFLLLGSLHLPSRRYCCLVAGASIAMKASVVTSTFSHSHYV